MNKNEFGCLFVFTNCFKVYILMKEAHQLLALLYEYNINVWSYV